MTIVKENKESQTKGIQAAKEGYLKESEFACKHKQEDKEMDQLV